MPPGVADGDSRRVGRHHNVCMSLRYLYFLLVPVYRDFGIIFSSYWVRARRDGFVILDGLPDVFTFFVTIGVAGCGFVKFSPVNGRVLSSHFLHYGRRQARRDPSGAEETVASGSTGIHLAVSGLQNRNEARPFSVCPSSIDSVDKYRAFTSRILRVLINGHKETVLTPMLVVMRFNRVAEESSPFGRAHHRHKGCQQIQSPISP